MKTDKNCKGTIFYRQIETILRRVVQDELAGQGVKPADTADAAPAANSVSKEDLQDAISQALVWAEARQRQPEPKKEEPHDYKLHASAKAAMIIFGLMGIFFLAAAVTAYLNTGLAFEIRMEHLSKLLLVAASFLVFLVGTYAVGKHKDSSFSFHVMCFLMALSTIITALISLS